MSYIKALIRQTRIKQALDVLHKAMPANKKNEIVFLQSKLAQLEIDVRMCNISYAEANEERGKIKEVALAYCQELETIPEPKRNYSRADVSMATANGNIVVQGVSGGNMSIILDGVNEILGTDPKEIKEFVKRHKEHCMDIIELLKNMGGATYFQIAESIERAINKQ